MGFFEKRRQKKEEAAMTGAQLYEKAWQLSDAGDKKGAYEYHLKAAEKDYPESILCLVHYISLGIVSDTSASDALPWVRKLKELGYGDAEITCLKHRGSDKPHTVDSLLELAREVEEENRIANMSPEEKYQNGRKHDQFSGMGVYKDCDPDAAKAFYWYKMAAEEGHISAQNLVGLIYQVGYDVVEPDYEEAFRWYLMAAFNPNFNERTADKNTIHSHKVAYDNLTGLFKHLPNYEALLYKYLPDQAGDIIESYNENASLLETMLSPEFLKIVAEAAKDVEREKNL